MSFMLLFLLCVVCLVEIWMLVRILEYMFCAFVLHQPPFVPANKDMRRAVVNEILAHYGAAENIVEIGSGYGGMARYIARRTGARVVAIENMPVCAGVSKFRDMFCGGRCHTVWTDAFKWLRDTDMHMDVAVAYMGPKITPRLAAHCDKFDVLILFEFEVPGMSPVRTIDISNGYTIYGGKKYPNRMYVYEFKNKKQKEKK